MDDTQQTTQQNLESAFAGECQANHKYLAFAEKAEKEGHRQVARMFRAAAESEAVHARNHLRAMGGVGSTKENLEAAVSGESYEFTKMYPEFILEAKAENNSQAETSFLKASEVEKIHHGLFQKALKVVEAGEKLADEGYFICLGCGNTMARDAPSRCSICGAFRAKFKRV